MLMTLNFLTKMISGSAIHTHTHRHIHIVKPYAYHHHIISSHFLLFLYRLQTELSQKWIENSKYFYTTTLTPHIYIVKFHSHHYALVLCEYYILYREEERIAAAAVEYWGLSILYICSTRETLLYTWLTVSYKFYSHERTTKSI